MASTFGKLFSVSTWGESHGPAVGAVLDGCPAGLPLTETDIQEFLDRRRPGQGKMTTARDEKDKVKILSGVFEGKTTGTPISFVVFNEDQHSKDYADIEKWYRPGHADLCYDLKYGFRDYRGGDVVPPARPSGASAPVPSPRSSSSRLPEPNLSPGWIP